MRASTRAQGQRDQDFKVLDLGDIVDLALAASAAGFDAVSGSLIGCAPDAVPVVSSALSISRAA